MELFEKVFEILKKNTVGFVEQWCTIECTCIRTETGQVDQTEVQIGFIRMQVQQVGRQAGIPHLPPSQNAWTVVKWLI